MSSRWTQRLQASAAGILCLTFCAGLGTPDRAIANDELRDHTAGAGEWRTEGRAARATQDWQLNVAREGDIISGTIVLGDSPLARTGTVHVRVRGNTLTGSIRADDGRHVARIFGQIDETGMRGTYRDRTGETGTWHAASLTDLSR